MVESSKPQNKVASFYKETKIDIFESPEKALRNRRFNFTAMQQIALIGQINERPIVDLKNTIDLTIEDSRRYVQVRVERETVGDETFERLKKMYLTEGSHNVKLGCEYRPQKRAGSMSEDEIPDWTIRVQQVEFLND